MGPDLVQGDGLHPLVEGGGEVGEAARRVDADRRLQGMRGRVGGWSKKGWQTSCSHCGMQAATGRLQESTRSRSGSASVVASTSGGGSSTSGPRAIPRAIHTTASRHGGRSGERACSRHTCARVASRCCS